MRTLKRALNGPTRAVASVVSPPQEIAMGELSAKKIAMIIAHEGFRDEELSVPLEIFKKAGADVKVASTSLESAKGKLGMRITPDVLYTDIDMKDYDAVVFVGGPGSPVYWDDPVAHKIAQAAARPPKVLAAICAAPPTLANAGLLKGKRVTSFPAEKDRLVAKGALHTGKGVEVDGNIVTGDGPRSAAKFAEEIIRLLKK
ncbi:MAG: DJ-1/PfpI family protein [Candidatus Omnitrophica bacterium]|nr:DJ-1/PfpI family protein [Candidatus Omnitrophota bacterium]